MILCVLDAEGMYSFAQCIHNGSFTKPLFNDETVRTHCVNRVSDA